MLTINGVKKSYGAFELGPIDLAVDAEVLSVLGPSGCGKTTLLSAVAGVVEPDAGTVTLNGADLAGRPPEERGTVLVFQDGALFPHMTARENVAYAAASAGNVEELAARLEVADVLDQRAATLSGGERQRVALARSLAADPDALLLDEPLANLDAPIKRRLRDELRPLLASLSIPVLYVTHDQHEATAIGDRLAVMAEGRIQQCDTPGEVFARPATPFVASFTGSTNLFRVRVAEADGSPVLEWGGLELGAPDHGCEIGETVQFCIRPEYVTVVESGVRERRNTLFGRVRRVVFEGDGYLVDVAPEGVDDVIRVTLSSPVYDRLELADGERVRLSLPSDAIHVIGAGE
ncbi:ABC transporter ATP-binding protein [Halococcus agarilyticus]|uniref:ABC transporter ATP-binding protein n=1 Tax=Halococcus agarilyticus TaxID=1232219 RepID=UPI000677F304|nr:ABC transporter ATP-binding protein [Halococcus agarilyticus]